MPQRLFTTRRTPMKKPLGSLAILQPLFVVIHAGSGGGTRTRTWELRRGIIYSDLPLPLGYSTSSSLAEGRKGIEPLEDFSRRFADDCLSTRPPSLWEITSHIIPTKFKVLGINPCHDSRRLLIIIPRIRPMWRCVDRRNLHPVPTYPATDLVKILL